MADSPHLGHGMIKLADIESFPGAIKATKTPASRFAYKTTVTTTFTAVAATDVCTAAVSLNSVNFTYSPVTFTTTGTLPAGLATSTTYFLIYISATTFYVATSWANADTSTRIDITDAGTGTHTINPVVVGTINHIIRDPRSLYYFLHDSNGRVWHTRGGNYAFLLTGNTLTNSAGNGLLISAFSSTTATYLFVFRNALVDVINVFGDTALNTPTWTSGWQTLNSAANSNNTHAGLNGQDQILYYCDDRYVGSIKEASGATFDPATGSTYVFTQDALDLPPYELAQCMEELGVNLLTGGNVWNKIYPWDRISDSFGVPLEVGERAVRQMKNIGGIIYIFAGYRGNIYITQGTFVKHFKKIPDFATNNSSTLQSNIITWGGVGARLGALIFGMSVQTTGNSGIYLLYPDGRLIMDNYPLTGSGQVNSFYTSTDEYYSFGFAAGADYIDTVLYSNLETIVQSQFFRVGTKTQPATYNTLEAQISRPATSGQARISYRTSLSASFTTLTTFSSDSATTSFKADIGLIDIENIQIQIEMNDGASGSVDFELIEVRLLP